MPEPIYRIITCEHGGNDVPAPYEFLFKGEEKILRSHRGYDVGALDVAQYLASGLDATFYFSTATRLLIDLNRSPRHRSLFSEFSRPLSQNAKEKIIEQLYKPYRSQVESDIERQTTSGKPVLHVSVHSFTPEYDGTIRTADIGLLYDPGRSKERQLCISWQKTMRELSNDITVRRNYPYLGKSDGLTTFLRKRFPKDKYIGIELEINQKLFTAPRPPHNPVKDVIIKSLATITTGQGSYRRLTV